MWQRGRLAGAVGLVVLALLAGCAPPAGTDGDLTDEWPALAEAVQAVPNAGDCYNEGHVQFVRWCT